MTFLFLSCTLEPQAIVCHSHSHPQPMGRRWGQIAHLLQPAATSSLSNKSILGTKQGILMCSTCLLAKQWTYILERLLRCWAFASFLPLWLHAASSQPGPADCLADRRTTEDHKQPPSKKTHTILQTACSPDAQTASSLRDLLFEVRVALLNLAAFARPNQIRAFMISDLCNTTAEPGESLNDSISDSFQWVE